MEADRPEKATVRGLWVDEVQRVDDSESDVPLYLTMPGAQGGDIQALIDAGVIDRTETVAIAEPGKIKLVAVESSPQAVVELQGKFPGLKILQEPIENLLHSEKLTSWPEGEHKRFFRARVVNWDMQCELEASLKQGQLSFPILALVRKLAILHSEPALDWTLCLTLNGGISWDAKREEKACQFLATNFARDEAFAQQARETLGDEIFDAFAGDPKSVRIGELSIADQQHLLMVLVPKKIAFDAHTHGWCVDTTENLRYGGSQGRAPMVTWVMRFRWDPRAGAEPDRVYREALGLALQRLGRIDADGVLHR